MFKIFMDGNDDRLRLENERGQQIGWIRGQAIGFSGLPSRRAAQLAAVKSWRAMEATLLRDYPGRLSRPVNASNVSIVHDGAYEWVAEGHRPLARLLDPSSHRNPHDSFALEFLVPSYATHHVTIAVAHAIWDVLQDHVSVEDAEQTVSEIRQRRPQLETAGVNTA